MLQETIQLETLRQKIEDAEYKSGSQFDYLDRGQPSAEQAKRARELIARLDAESKALKPELQALITRLRSENPQAVEAWINMHIGLLNQVLAEIRTDTDGKVRKTMAQNTVQAWEKVRAGEQAYVGINWHFLKDYKAEVRKQLKPNNKAWWKFWA